MMRVFLIFYLCICALGPASAQSIRIRTAEHGQFTRVAFDVPSGAVWSTEQDDKSIFFRVENHVGGFQTNQIYERINRRRVAQIVSSNTTAEIQLSCDCTATAFSFGRNMVVIDIAGAPASGGPPFETEDQAAKEAISSPETTASDLKLIRLAFERDAPDGHGKPDSEPTPKPSVLREKATETVATLGLPQLETPEALATFQSQLSRQVADAATRGILEPRFPNIPQVAVKPKAETKIERRELPLPVAAEPFQGPSPESALRITSSMDFSDANAAVASSSTDGGLGCLRPQTVAIETWAEVGSIGPQIATARRALFGEFDRLNSEAALRLARLYLHFGFGPEAMRTLTLDPELQTRHGILLEMGEVFEFGHVRKPKILHRHLDCDSALALWAVLASQEIPKEATVNVKAALRSLNALPSHLRDILTPIFSRRMLSYGDVIAAETALSAVARLPLPKSADTQMVQASVDLANGDVARAQDTLVGVISSNAEQSAEALIALVESRINEDQEIEPDQLVLIDALAKELRNDDLGPDLRVAAINARTHMRAYDDALTAIDALPSDANATMVQALRQDVMKAVVQKADDATFLDIIFSPRAPSDLPDKTNLALAERLTSLGFADAAESRLEQMQSAPEAEAVKILMAQIALAKEKPALAEAHLIGKDGDTATRLRAQAREMTGQYATASTLYAEVGNEEAAHTAAFMADDWQGRISQDVPLVGPLIRLTNERLARNPARDGMLARGENAIRESAAARADIQRLLEAPLNLD